MNTALVTHCYTDHIHHIMQLKSRSKPPQIYLPSDSSPKLKHFIDFAQQLTSNLTSEEYEPIPCDVSYVMNGVEGGRMVQIDEKRSLIAHVTECDHGVPCVGYCISQIRQSL